MFDEVSNKTAGGDRGCSVKEQFKESEDTNQRSGRGRITCPFHCELEHILGDEPSCQPLELYNRSCDAGKDETEAPGATGVCWPS